MTDARLVLPFLLALPAVSAQTTWIVDPNGGGNFTRLAPALAVAAPDDTVLVRGGNYTGNHAIAVPLHLIGDGPQTPWIEQIHMATNVGPLSSFRDLAVGELRATGTVMIDNVRVDSVNLQPGAHASLHHCTIGFGASGAPATDRIALNNHGARTVLNTCTVRGNLGFELYPLSCTLVPGNAIVMTGGTLSITDSVIEGAGPVSSSSCPGPLPPGSGIVAYGGSVRLTRSSVTGGTGYVQAAAIWVNPAGQPAVADPSVVFSPTPYLGTVAIESFPGTTANSALPGGSITAAVHAEPNRPAAIVAALGFRGPSSTLFGEAWIHPQINLVLRIGSTDATGALSATITLPITAPQHLPITFQGLVLPPANGNLALAAPAPVQVR